MFHNIVKLNPLQFVVIKNLAKYLEMSISIAAFGPGDPRSNTGWFAVLNSNQNRVFIYNTSIWYSSKYYNPVMGCTLVGGGK